MRWIGMTLNEVAGLFVDDYWLASAIAAWLLLAWVGRPWLGAGWAGLALFAGLSAILLVSTARRAKQ